MLRSAGGFAGEALTLSLRLVFVSLEGALRLLPMLVPVVSRGIWVMIVISCRLYYLVLTRIAPAIERRCQIQILEGLWRMAATLLMSLTIGLIVLVIASLPINVVTCGVLIMHSLFVDAVWDEIAAADGLQLGVKL